MLKSIYLLGKFEKDMELYWGQSNQIKEYNFMVSCVLVNLSCFALRFRSLGIRLTVNHAALLGFLPILSKGGIQIRKLVFINCVQMGPNVHPEYD